MSGEKASPSNGGESKQEEEKEYVDVEELRKKAQEYDELLERHRRLMAEFMNYKTRAEKERSSAALNARRKTLLLILPLVDDLFRAVDAAKNCEDLASLQEGLALTQQRLRKVLSSIGVKEIEALDAPFDPLYHEAVAICEREDVDSERVVEVFERGYLITEDDGEEILRPAKVLVAKPKSKK